MQRRPVWLLIALITSTASATVSIAQEKPASPDQAAAMKRLLQVVKSRPYFALSWHDLKLAVADDQSAAELKVALAVSGRSASSAHEQAIWVDAAAGHPEAALAFYDNNIKLHPEDLSLLNAACYARANHGLDLQNALAICDAAIAADPKPYTYMFRGEAELQLGLNAKALADFDTAIADPAFRNHPMLAEAVYGRGVARLRLNEDGGRKDIGVAMKVDKNVAAKFSDFGIVP